MFRINKNKKIILVALVVLVFLAVGGYFIFGQNLGQKAEKKKGGVNEDKTKQAELDLDYLDSAKVKKFELHGHYPIEMGDTGRDNPFLPY